MTAAALITFSYYRPDLDLVHLWDDPNSRAARIFCTVALCLELIVSRECTTQLRDADSDPDPYCIDIRLEGPTPSTSTTGRLQRSSTAAVCHSFPPILPGRHTRRRTGTRPSCLPHLVQQPSHRGSLSEPHLRHAILYSRSSTLVSSSPTKQCGPKVAEHGHRHGRRRRSRPGRDGHRSSFADEEAQSR